ncbi:MAG: hypothetical protein EBR73_16505 [Rhodobacteraceae bacterium]|nr:hypothetical protein [Paracoccaceae bacterium]
MLEFEAEYATDVTEDSDIIVATGATSYKISMGGHATLTAAQRATLKDAAETSWAALRTAWIGIDDRAASWLDGMTGAEKDALRRTMRRPLLPA